MNPFIKNYRQYGDSATSWDAFKTVAILIMIADHIGSYFFPEQLWWRSIGRIGFPIWFFFAGYARVSAIGIQLPVFAIILVAVDVLFGREIFPINALLTIICCRLFVKHAVTLESNLINTLLLLICLLLLHLIAVVLFEYGAVALLFALWGYWVRMNNTRISFFLMLVCFAVFSYSQYYGFHFSMEQQLFFMLGTALMCYFLQNIKVSHFTSHIRIVDVTLMFLGRNSLYIYVIHLFIFIFLEWVLLKEQAPPLFEIKLF